MKAFLKIELVGDDTVQMFKMFRGQLNDVMPGMGNAALGSWPASGWVSEITGTDPKFKYQRQFLRYNKDYSKANSKGSRGVYAHFILESGRIYEVKEYKRRYFCKVSDDGDIIQIDEEEVRQWLKNICPSMS